MIVRDISLDCRECGEEVLAEVDTEIDDVRLCFGCWCPWEQQAYALEQEAIKRAHESGPQEWHREGK